MQLTQTHILADMAILTSGSAWSVDYCIQNSLGGDNRFEPTKEGWD